MQKLLLVLLDICLLRRGPEDIPYSKLLFSMCVGLWLLALLATMLSIENFDGHDAGVAIASALVGLLAYVTLISLTGFGNRTLQTLSALVGCGALISVAMLAFLLLVTPLAGALAANFGAFLLLAWSVPVKGHIIARALDRHWYIGIVIALSIFLLQLTFTQMMTPEA
jgi:hypothetical protein